MKTQQEIMLQAAKLLRDIDKAGGLKQGGEQYPNGMNCHDIADKLEALATQQEHRVVR